MGVDMVMVRAGVRVGVRVMTRVRGRDTCLDRLAQGAQVVLLGHQGAGLAEGPEHGVLCLLDLFGGHGEDGEPFLVLLVMGGVDATCAIRRRARHVYFL